MARGYGFYNKDWFAIKQGKDLIYESIIRILMTSPNERVMTPTFGVGMRSKVFMTITPDTLQDLAVEIHSKLVQFENRIKVTEVQTEFNEDDLSLKIHLFTQRIDSTEIEEITLSYDIPEGV
jgi:phage baseplate assembly protein W